MAASRMLVLSPLGVGVVGGVWLSLWMKKYIMDLLQNRSRKRLSQVKTKRLL
jgi:hypothetical protein